MRNNASEFELIKNEQVNFLEKFTEINVPYTKAHEDTIMDWAYEQSTRSKENFGYIEQIGVRSLAIYDAYVSMQMQLNIEPVYDLEVAREFKRIMGITHNDVLKLQKLALSSEFSNFLTSVYALDISKIKKLWNELKNHNEITRSTLKSYFNLQKIRRKKIKGDYKKAVKDFFKIPVELRIVDELKFVTINKLQTLLDYKKREEYREKQKMLPTLEGNKLVSIKVNREKIKVDKKLRIFMEIWQRNGSYTTEELDKKSFTKPNTFKVGEISEILSLLAHIDPKRRRKTPITRNITNDAVYRSVMTFIREQNFFINEIYKLPKNQFNIINNILEKKHGFKLKEDTNDVIQKVLETGGGAYALYSNHNIRSSKSQEEKNKHYSSFGKRPNLTFSDAVRNPSTTEKLRILNTERPGIGRAPLHIFRGGDIFNVLQKASDAKVKKAKDYMQIVYNQGYRTYAGISGTTARLFAVAESLGLLKNKQDHKYLLTACIGYMVPLAHHSVYEITSTLKSFNIPYKHTLGLVDGVLDFMKDERLNERVEKLNKRNKDFKNVIKELHKKEMVLKKNTSQQHYNKKFLR